MTLPPRQAAPDVVEYFAACTLGLEGVLANELEGLGVDGIESGRGGVRFEGDRTAGYRVALWSRTAVRLQETIGQATIDREDDLYDWVASFGWDDLMRVDQTLAVDASIRDSVFRHSKYAALRVKDAIVDQFRERARRRPSVDTKRPDLQLKLHLQRDQATLYRDLVGGSLHKRGYRPIQVKSPLNESIAAGLVLLSEWDRRSPLCDPMCGSATIAIEAAWIAADRAPGLKQRFAFERWPDFDAKAWRGLIEDAFKRMSMDSVPRIDVADRHPGAIAIAKESIKLAGLRDRIRVHHTALADFHLEAPPAVVLCNPPWGERLDPEDLEASWRDLGDFLRRECPLSIAWILSGNPAIGHALRLKADRKIPVHNGPIECRVLRYEIGERR
ncbi:MAG: RNA methyltransferase [Planctomycetes bacterium]|nr:RNA methyltransferase [Planctomycetota bacterium]